MENVLEFGLNLNAAKPLWEKVGQQA